MDDVVNQMHYFIFHRTDITIYEVSISKLLQHNAAHDLSVFDSMQQTNFVC